MLWTSVPTTGDSNSTVTPKIRSQALLQAAARRSQDKAQMAAFGAAPAAGSSVGNVNAPATRATGSKDKAFSKWKPPPMPKPTPEDYVIVIKPRESVSLHEAFTETGYGTAISARDPPDGGSETVLCDSWDFDLSEYGDNIVSEWQLVCHRRRLLDLALYTTFLASVLWLPMMGLAADRVGRKIVVYISIPALLITGFASSVTGSFQFYVALRTVVSASIVSVMTVAFVVLYEATPAGRRTLYCFTALALAQVTRSLYSGPSGTR
ncbi:hypothetical protein V5799_029741 [Amblyomma americanum]|uniref:Major facilitator superfamily (MFS) profile domain-containing protein n=1 Tax=Amblyomma americanum TaxID=6943 RepID=A0AAQ4EQ84_AMBAM